MITKFITTRIESIARSAARRPRYAPAHPQLFRPRLTTTRGGHIAAVCFRLRSPPDLYFATHTVQDIDISIADRTLHALIGPNGAGKTTAFNLLSGMYTPDHGQVSLAGQPIAGL